MLYDDEARKLRDHGPTQMRRPTQKVAFAPLDRPVKAWSRQAGEVVQHLWIALALHPVAIGSFQKALRLGFMSTNLAVQRYDLVRTSTLLRFVYRTGVPSRYQHAFVSRKDVSTRP